MAKEPVGTIREKNRIVENIVRAMTEREEFLLCGHQNPDEDCISSMVALAILLSRFDKPSSIYLNSQIPANVSYLLSICKYNGIRVLNAKSRVPAAVDTIIICDTPKRDMLDVSRAVETAMKRKGVLVMEFDHHIGADSNYMGDEGYRLVTDASSTCELIGYLALKLRNMKGVLNRFMIADPFSRNFVLAILTGIISDTNMGRFLKTKREKKYYAIFSSIYNEILAASTVRENNITSGDEIYRELQRLSRREEDCYQYIIGKRQLAGHIAYVVLTEDEMDALYRDYDQETINSVTKTAANDLAESTGKIGLVVFFDDKSISDLVQFRMRRSQHFKTFDLRSVLERFNIENGGGHEGAVGFRFPRGRINDARAYTDELVQGVNSILADAGE